MRASHAYTKSTCNERVCTPKSTDHDVENYAPLGSWETSGDVPTVHGEAHNRPTA